MNPRRIMSRVSLGAVGAAVVVVSGIAGAGAGNAQTPTDTQSVVEQSVVVSESCMDQVEAIAAEEGVSMESGIELCSATVTTTESDPLIATVADIEAYASEERLSVEEKASLVRSAASGAIKYRNWTHSYWGGSLLENHKGRTYWDGSRAWIASYRGFTGSHTCHSEGGVAVGWAVKPISCSKPAAAASADAFYRFDASVAFQGSPITLAIGLHYSTSKSGQTSTWQVGG